ncbi:MAG: site-specific integrase [Candidatus Thiodiazotropha endolucinida]|nr:site-specific integrase [Candidatus Thiodiazotropha endolucinida]
METNNGEVSELLDKNTLPILSGPVSRHANPVDTYLAGKSDHTQRMVRSHMTKVARLFNYKDYLNTPWGGMRYQHAQEVVGLLTKQGYAPNTINAVIASIRGVATAAFYMNQMDGDDLERIRGVRMVRGSRLKSGRVVPPGELTALVQCCLQDNTPAGIRDVAIIGCLYICGMRRSEVSSLKVSNINLKEKEVRLIGKGNKERKSFLDSGTKAAIRDWLGLRGEHDGALFFRVLKGGRIVGGNISDQAIYVMLQKRWSQAGIPPVSPHDFRRTFISTLLSKGIDLLTVQKMADHSDPRTTSGYDLRPEEDMKKAAHHLHLPYSDNKE